MKLPLELIYEILNYIEFNKIIKLFPKIANKFYDYRVHTLDWGITTNDIIILKWLQNNVPQNLEFSRNFKINEHNLGVLKFLQNIYNTKLKELRDFHY